MAIKRYTANKDNTITNAYKSNLTRRGVSGNMGQADILETFAIYAQESSASHEKSRILVQFPVDTMLTDRNNGDLPASGSVSFYLRLFNAEHSQTTPKNFTLAIQPISKDWDEGLGLDMEEYADIDASNWISASEGTAWTAEGGDYLDDLSSSFSQTFDTGFEDMEVDISSLVEQWISASNGSPVSGDPLGSKTNYGVGIFLTSSLETASYSYYTKKFFARQSQFFFKRPMIEARWDDSKSDDRNNFYLSSSLVPASDNLMNLYLYNIVKGQLTDIPAVGTNPIHVSIFSGSSTTGPTGSALFLPAGGGVVTLGDVNVTASHVETGIYSASFAYPSASITTIYDVWHSGTSVLASSERQYHTGSMIAVKTYDSSDYSFDRKYVSNVSNIKDYYFKNEDARFRLYIRNKNWSPNIYTIASQEIENTIVNSVYYKIVRVADNLNVVPYGTGSTNHTKVSYDASGSYFDFDMSMLESDSVYALNFIYKINGKFVEQSEEYRFRVE